MPNTRAASFVDVHLPPRTAVAWEFNLTPAALYHVRCHRDTQSIYPSFHPCQRRISMKFSQLPPQITATEHDSTEALRLILTTTDNQAVCIIIQVRRGSFMGWMSPAKFALAPSRKKPDH